MWIKIRTDSVKFSMPVPLSMVSFAIRAIPEAAFEDMRKKACEKSGSSAYTDLIDKNTVCYFWQECKDSLKDYRGLELVHVEAADGTFISIRL